MVDGRGVFLGETLIFFKVIWKLFLNSLGILFGFKGHFWINFQLQRSINDLQNGDFQSKCDTHLIIEKVIFCHFEEQKSRILKFFKDVQEMSYLGRV